MPTVSFKTSRGKKVTFKTRTSRKSSKSRGSRRSRKLNPFAKLVRKMSREKQYKSGKALFKAASREYRK